MLMLWGFPDKAKLIILENRNGQNLQPIISDLSQPDVIVLPTGSVQENSRQKAGVWFSVFTWHCYGSPWLVGENMHCNNIPLHTQSVAWKGDREWTRAGLYSSRKCFSNRWFGWGEAYRSGWTDWKHPLFWLRDLIPASPTAGNRRRLWFILIVKAIAKGNLVMPV